MSKRNKTPSSTNSGVEEEDELRASSSRSSTKSANTTPSKKPEKPCNVGKDSTVSRFKFAKRKSSSSKDVTKKEETKVQDEENRRKSHQDQLRTAQESHEKSSHDERVRELKDQNQYLMEKVQFLKMQKTRNEKEIDRMDAKQMELKKMHDMYSKQLGHIENLIGEWEEFHTALMDASGVWAEAAEKMGREESKNNEVLAPLVMPELV